MRVLIFGDSIAQGFYDTEGGWVARLRKHYDQRQLKDVFNNDEPTIFNLGISGDITPGIIKRLRSETHARKWRWPEEQFSFIFAIGINDSIIDENGERSSPSKYRRELQIMIAQAKEFSNRILLVGLTPCEEEIVNRRPDKTKQFDNNRIREFNQTLLDVCEQERLPCVPIYQNFEDKMRNGERLFADGLHPNDVGHQLIFELVRPELDKLLKN